MKRYDFYGSFDGGGPAISEASNDGEYVLHSDHEAALAAMKAERDTAVAALNRLVAAATPFTSADVVDETSGTIPLIDELEAAIDAARKEGHEEVVVIDWNAAIEAAISALPGGHFVDPQAFADTLRGMKK